MKSIKALFAVLIASVVTAPSGTAADVVPAKSIIVLSETGK